MRTFGLLAWLFACGAACTSHADCEGRATFCAEWGACAHCSECHFDHDAVDGACPAGCGANKHSAPRDVQRNASKLKTWGIDVSLWELLGDDGVPELLPQTYGANGNLEALPGLRVDLTQESYSAHAAASSQPGGGARDEDGDEDADYELERSGDNDDDDDGD